MGEHSHIPIDLHRLFRIKSELQEIYMNQVLQNFAVSLVGIFVPIFILSLGFSLVTTLMFMAVYYAGLGLLSPLAGRLASRVGLKHAILYSSPLIVLYYVLLVLMEHFSMVEYILLYPVGFLGGAAFGLYWTSLNSEFVRNSHKFARGRETARLIAYPKLAAIAAPVIGAFLIANWGYDALFTFVVLVMGLSVTPLFATNDYRGSFRFSLKDTRFVIGSRLATAFFARGVTFMTECVMWPLFIFLMFNDLMAVGIASALSGIGITIFTLFIGRLCDRMDKSTIIRLGGAGYAVIWFTRMFVTTELEVFILSLIGGMLMTMIAVSLFSSFSDMGRRGNIVGNVISRELWLSIGRIVGLVLFALAMGSFQFAFAVSGIMALLFLLYKT